jgi:hypothetical protein
VGCEKRTETTKNRKEKIYFVSKSGNTVEGKGGAVFFSVRLRLGELLALVLRAGSLA